MKLVVKRRESQLLGFHQENHLLLTPEKSYCSFSRNNGELEEIDLSLAAAPVSVGCWSRGHPEEGKLLKIGRRHCVWAPGSLSSVSKSPPTGSPTQAVSPQPGQLLLFLILLFLLISLLPLQHNSFIFPVSSRGSFWSFLCMNIGASEDCVLEWAVSLLCIQTPVFPRVCLISWAACKIQDLESCSSLFDSVAFDGVKTFNRHLETSWETAGMMFSNCSLHVEAACPHQEILTFNSVLFPLCISLVP